MGRVIWNLKKNESGGGYTLNGCFPIRPRLIGNGATLVSKGDPTIGGNLDQTLIQFEEDKEDYANSFQSVLDYGIANKQFYIKKDEPLVNYKWIKNKKKSWQK